MKNNPDLRLIFHNRTSAADSVFQLTWNHQSQGPGAPNRRSRSLGEDRRCVGTPSVRPSVGFLPFYKYDRPFFLPLTAGARLLLWDVSASAVERRPREPKPLHADKHAGFVFLQDIIFFPFFFLFCCNASPFLRG